MGNLSVTKGEATGASRTIRGAEVWRPVPGFGGWYDVSTRGRVRSWRTRAVLERRASRPRRLTPKPTSQGYLRVKLTHPVLGKLMVAVHHLVVAAFVRPRPHGMVCDHINAKRSDNRVENLRWLTPAENVRHAASLGRLDGRPGSRAQSKLNPDDVREIRRLREEGASLRTIAESYGISSTSVSAIAKRKCWKEV